MPTLEEMRREYDALQRKLADPGKSPGREIARLTKRHAELREIIDLAAQIERTTAHLREHEVEAQSTDAELRQLAVEELPKLQGNLKRLAERLQEKLNPTDPHAAGNAILEIRAGTGGEEASLFARDLLAMYLKYAEKQGWTTLLVSASRGDLGGYKEAIGEVRGPGAYGTLRRESGVHRVQRIPTTEKSGRVHTSTATVAVLPVANEEEMEIRPQDLQIDTFRAGGHGGQHVQKTESAVRVTHLPTGLVVSCQDERSQHANKESALSVLRSRLLARQLEQQTKSTQDARRKQIGTGERSEKIRTYNFPQDRVTDHRIKKTWHGIDRVLDGDLEPIISALRTAASAAHA